MSNRFALHISNSIQNADLHKQMAFILLLRDHDSYLQFHSLPQKSVLNYSWTTSSSQIMSQSTVLISNIQDFNGISEIPKIFPIKF